MAMSSDPCTLVSFDGGENSVDRKSRKRKLAYTKDDGVCDNINRPEQSSKDQNTVTDENCQVQVGETVEKSGSCNVPPNNQPDSYVKIKQLQLIIKKEEERLRKLKMVKMYREKNNLEELGELIDKWRDVCQQSFEDLLELLPSPRPSSKELLDHLQIDYDLVHFDVENESFS